MVFRSVLADIEDGAVVVVLLTCELVNMLYLEFIGFAESLHGSFAAASLVRGPLCMSVFSSWEKCVVSTRFPVALELSFEADWPRSVQTRREGVVETLLQPEALLVVGWLRSSHTCRGGMVEVLCGC
jgi:hypothetical protein